MKQYFKNYIKNSHLAQKIADIYIHSNFMQTYRGQNAEDIFLSSYFRDKHNGFYIDIGAHHPIRFSNTFSLYQKGWHGINIDPLPGSMQLFNKLRPRDINLEIAIYPPNTRCSYYNFVEPAYNTMNEKLAQYYIDNQRSKLKSILEVKSETLKSILNKYVSKQIDLLTIDIEESEYEALDTNDWNLYKPQLIIIESVTPFNDIYNDKKINFLIEKGYHIIGKLLNAVYLEKN